MSLADPTVVFLDDAASAPEDAQLALACRFYGFRLVALAPSSPVPSDMANAAASGTRPVLIVVHASALAQLAAATGETLLTFADRHHIPVATVGLTPNSDPSGVIRLARGVPFRMTDAGPGCGLWVAATEPDQVGFELRGLRFALDPGPVGCLESPAGLPVQVLAEVGPNETQKRPALLRLKNAEGDRYLLTRTTKVSPGTAWQFQRAAFGEIAPLFLLLRDAGGARAWRPPAALANLTIDDPWLTEPYGCLSFPGLLAEMQREPFHATIGFVPWNYDRSFPEVVAIFRDHPAHFSLAVHGNNHDRYEFFRYTAQPGDQQRPKSFAEQTYNIRQAAARMALFQQGTGLSFDRVMVFPHGVCPAPTFAVLKENGFWATSNYSNVPLGERPPTDPAVALRGANAEWSAFPALRRLYPHNYSEEAIAIDLFLGNPVMFMAHQDLFFSGIEAFTPVARQVNRRQPAVRWAGLGEISRNLHLVRWPDDSHAEVRLLSRHAKIENLRSTPVVFHLAKRETDPQAVVRVTVDGRETPWTFVAGEVQFALTAPPGATHLVEVHYQLPASPEPVDVRRQGFRNRVLRLIADFRDLTLSRSLVGRLLTSKYYRQGKRRPTLSGLAANLFRRNGRPAPRPPAR